MLDTFAEFASRVVEKQPTMGDAIKLAIQVSGLTDKAIYMDLGIDPGQWSRILSGNAHFPHNKLTQFCDVVGNDVILDWFALQRGKETKMLETTAERRIHELEAELEKERLKNEHFQEFLKLK